MLGRRIATLVLLTAAPWVTAATASAQAPDPYSPAVDTRCSVSVPTSVRPGARVVARARVQANSPSDPTGAVTLTVRNHGSVVWSRTVDYPGHPIRVDGPVLGTEGSYRVTAAFRAEDPRMFRRCADAAEFAVDAVGGEQDPDRDPEQGPGGDSLGGILPDTGGPDLLWLLLGLALVGGGAGAVVYSRRRHQGGDGSPAPTA